MGTLAGVEDDEAAGRIGERGLARLTPSYKIHRSCIKPILPDGGKQKFTFGKLSTLWDKSSRGQPHLFCASYRSREREMEADLYPQNTL